MLLGLNKNQKLPMDDQTKRLLEQLLPLLKGLDLHQIMNMIGECGSFLMKYKIGCKENYFEPYSVNTAKLYNFLIADGSVTSELINSGQIDVSGPLLYLGNIIEYELNASIGQAMRKILLDIEMPRYHMEWFPMDEDETEKDYEVPAGRGKLNLNRGYENPQTHNVKLLTSTIGDLCYAYKDMLKYLGDDPDLEIIPAKLRQKDNKGNFFTYELIGFGNLRNKAAHAGEVDMDVFDNAFKLYSRIVDEYMPAIAELKSRLKTPPQN